MRIVTWNVNSVRARLPRLLPWLEEKRPEVVCLQELKCVDEVFPREDIEALGYNIETFGQKTYNGVAILSQEPMDDVRRGFPGDGDEARAIGANIGDVMVLCLYVVNGRAVDHPKYDHKLKWLGSLADHVAATYDVSEKVVICGDMNVTFDDRDVFDPEAWKDKVLCSTPEREALAKVMQPGYVDAFREFHEEGGQYTWWDFRTRAFRMGRRNNGLRIDHFLLSAPAMASCTGVEVDLEARDGEKPSDHAPVIATLA
jgi:exodeoxyribonuclease-3